MKFCLPNSFGNTGSATFGALAQQSSAPSFGTLAQHGTGFGSPGGGGVFGGTPESPSFGAGKETKFEIPYFSYSISRTIQGCPKLRLLGPGSRIILSLSVFLVAFASLLSLHYVTKRQVDSPAILNRRSFSFIYFILRIPAGHNNAELRVAGSLD